MLLSHNAENLEGEHTECMSVDFHGRPSSLNRFMEGKGRARDGFTFELCPGQRHEVTVEVRAHYQMLENDEPGKACRDVEDDEDSEFDCRSRCRMEMIRVSSAILCPNRIEVQIFPCFDVGSNF
ncbi:unnamed protein product [Cylicostephanus goldi]|uniref:Uncharacterized protein n=1 Tax=Cylicostephanus goldi TaxID=71465 RepID=A0A3P7MS03_CYLGO|nr:unnamed protein product [Cylicostephanus goldi]